MDEDQMERLEAYLDGALSPEEASALRRQIEREPALRAQLDQLRAERAVRISAFASMARDEPIGDRLLDGLRSRVEAAPPIRRRRWLAPIRYAIAAAACLALGFAAGRLLETPGKTGVTRLTPAAHESVYRVAITDDSGQVIAVQPFESLEQATEFSEDLRRWQARQEQIRNGQVTVRSARF